MTISKIDIMRTLFIAITLISTIGLNAQKVQWLSWDDAVALSKSEASPKKVFVDVYTDWCGWCKKMDKDTFQNPEVAQYMQENFYMVKFNAEGKEPIEFDGRTFEYVPSGRRGYHQLAAALLQNRLSYPTVVFLDENMKMLSPVPGYQKVQPFMQIAKYFGENIYKEQDWKSYSGIGK